MIEPRQANWQALDDKDIVILLRNSEGKNSTDRALFLEAARRIEAQAAAVAQAVAESDALIVELYEAWKDAPLQIAQRTDRAEAMTKAAAAIRARNGGK